MPNQINITSLVGKQPFKVYVCNTAFQNCVLVNNNLTSNSYTFLAPSQFNGYSQLGIKVIGDDGCELLSGITLSTQTITPQYEDLCFTFVYGNPIPTQTIFSLFKVNGSDNGKPVWSSTTLNNVFFKWIPVRSQWEFFGLNNSIINRDTSNTPNSNTWNIIGTNTTGLFRVSSNAGNCPSYLPISATLNISNALCLNSNTGSISVIASGGIPGLFPNPTYQYSIDGINYQTSNIFNNLTPNTYTVFVKDSINNIFQISGVVSSVSNTFQNYIFTTIIINQNTLNNPPFSRTAILDWQVQITPSLPPGVTVTFDLFYNDDRRKYQPGEVDINNNYTVSLNGTQQTTLNSVTTSRVSNRSLSCSNYLIYQTGITDTYSSLTIGSGDVMSGSMISTISILDAINDNGCTTQGENIIDLFFTNIRLNGCSCCSIVGEPQQQLYNILTSRATRTQ